MREIAAVVAVMKYIGDITHQWGKENYAACRGRKQIEQSVLQITFNTAPLYGVG
jgi:hypothetical protein